MENPFVFGRAAEGAYFTDRQEETKRLAANLTHGINTVLVSPRRWGKTSLVKKVMSDSSSSKTMFVFIDIFKCKSEYDFLKSFANEVIKQTASKVEEWIEMAKTFLSNITPKFSFGSDPLNDFSLSFEWNTNGVTAVSILNLPEKIARKKGVRIVVCLDEFQQIADFQDSVFFQRMLRSAWQHHQDVTYCMSGSKKHLMDHIFNDKSMPFYKFGDMMFLEKIPSDEWVKYIMRQFRSTGKEISEKHALQICTLAENLSSYVQHLSWIVWYKAGKVVIDKDITTATEYLLEQNEVFFQREIEQLTEFQLNFLRALSNGVATGFSRKEIINRYRPSSSSNIQNIKKALLKKDLIYMDGTSVVFDDPIFKLWIKNNFSTGTV